jgi:hypothetical protein
MTEPYRREQMKYRDNMTPEELTQFMAEVNALDAVLKSAADHDAQGASQNLIDEVLKQIKCDVDSGDMTAIEEMIRHLPEGRLRGYLSEYENPSDYVGMGWVGKDGRP